MLIGQFCLKRKDTTCGDNLLIFQYRIILLPIASTGLSYATVAYKAKKTPYISVQSL